MKASHLVLRPNCLLTRKPIVFIQMYNLTWPFSLLCSSNWGTIPSIIQAHGYQVQIRTVSQIKAAGRSSPAHFFIIKNDFPDLNMQLVKSYLPDQATLTVYKDPPTDYNELLDQCIHLAELDFTSET